MKILAVIQKSLREQLRSFWILLLTVSMAPFFVGVYYLILESYEAQYDILVLNLDKGTPEGGLNHGQMLVDGASLLLSDSSELPFRVWSTETREKGLATLKNRKADAMIVIPADFSTWIHHLRSGNLEGKLRIEFIGDLTNMEYMVSAVWGNAAVTQYLDALLDRSAYTITETSLGLSGSITEFELMVPGLLIIALIMLMFTATIAIIVEVENKTILRMKFSRLKTFEFLAGASIVQVMVGLVAILLTLAVAIACGFSHYNALWEVLFIAVLTSLSIFAFSLILAGATKTVNEVLIVGNFPMFLFMFFSGAAFPLEGKALFSVAGYPVSLQGLMSPTHAISALKKTMIMEMSLGDVFPEIIALVILTLLYTGIGIALFRKRHMKME
jgi:ABC-2 type transport system permease protein